MSGLIWAGLGRGIADAGAAYSSAMARGAELQWQEQRDEQREARALQRAEALERLKESLLEERAQRDAAKAVEVESRATKIGEERSAKQLTTDVNKLGGVAQQVQGDSPAATAEDFRKLMEENPQYREVYRKAGLIDRGMTRNEQRLQAVDDTVQAARELGASSTLLKSYQDTKKSVLDAIREENRERRDEQRHIETMTQQQRLSDQFNAMLPIRQQQADASTTSAGAAVTNANRPRPGTDSGDKPITGVDLERNAKAAERALALELGVPLKDVQTEVARLRKRNQLTPEQQTRLEAYNSALTRWQNYKSPSAAPKPSDNSGTRPPLSSFQKP